MHPPEVKRAALELIAAGLNDCEVSRRLEIPRGTIRDWRRPPYVAHRAGPVTCWRCWGPSAPIRVSSSDYALLLGLYLGDGSVSQHARTQRLRITLDERYPEIIDATRALLVRCFPANRIGAALRRSGGRCADVSVYHRHLSCLLPQHGPGAKHNRRIRLERWQDALLRQSPWAFLKGCIWSDGCVFINRTDVHRDQPYEYLSYQFANRSEDIARLFVSVCEEVGVATRMNRSRRGLYDVRINRRASVELMERNVGRKR